MILKLIFTEVSCLLFSPQINTSRKNYLQGLFLPQDFRLSPTPCRSGLRTAWGGEIGGLSKNVYRTESQMTRESGTPVDGRQSSEGTSHSSESIIRLGITKPSLWDMYAVVSIPYHTTPHHTIPCYTIPYHTTPYIPYHSNHTYHITPYHAILCRSKPWRKYILILFFYNRTNGAKSAASFVKLGLSIDSPYSRCVKSKHRTALSPGRKTAPQSRAWNDWNNCLNSNS